MSGTIETISDQARFDQIFSNELTKSNIYLRTSSGDLKIKFLGYTSGQAAFKIPYIKSMPDSALVFCRVGQTTIYVELKYIEKQEDEIFTFSPLKVQLIHTSRSEERTESSARNEKSILFITNATSDFLIYDCIKRERRKLEFIRDKIFSDLQKLFSEVKVNFISEETGDARLRYFIDENNTPLYIYNYSAAPPKGQEKVYAFYKELIYSKEQFNLKRKSLISEISTPILYKGKIPYGYLLVNSTFPLGESHHQLLVRASELAAKVIDHSGILNDICVDRLLVSNFSRNGISFVFKERKYIRFFKEKSIVYFEIIIPGGIHIPVSATVTNIALLENKVIKVGCEYRIIDDEMRKTYDEYLSAHSTQKQPPEKEKPSPPPAAEPTLA